MFDQAVELYTLALSKGGIDANIAQTRLGIASFAQGKYADADAYFAKVGGPRQTVAKLWQVLTANKMAAAPAAPAS